MRILVISSCTGKKVIHHSMGLTIDDFRMGAERVKLREDELREYLLPAEEMYTGEQHKHLMRGVSSLSNFTQTGRKRIDLDLWIASAGYGLVPGDQQIAPYNATFNGMSKKTLRTWASQIGIPNRFRAVLTKPYDLGLVLLGTSYLLACDIDESLILGGPTLFLCGSKAAHSLPPLPDLIPVILNNDDAKRFSAGQVALKGVVASQILNLLATDYSYLQAILNPRISIPDLLMTS